jgi:hypothetical protein
MKELAEFRIVIIAIYWFMNLGQVPLKQGGGKLERRGRLIQENKD